MTRYRARRGPRSLDEHPVLGQRPGLVRADHRHRPEGLDGRQAANEGAPRRHPSRSQGQGDGDHGRQALGDGRDREADRRQEHRARGLAAGEARREHDRAYREGQPRELRAQACEPPLERRLVAAGPLDQLGDLAERGRHTRLHDDPRPTPGGHGRARECDVAAIRDVACVQLRQRLHHLRRRLRFAGQGRFVDPQGLGLGQPQVGRDEVANRQHHEVSRDDLRRGDRDRRAVADDGSHGARQAAQGIHRPLGAVLLHEPDQGVEHDDGQDDDRVLEVADRGDDDGGNHEDEDHRARDLPREHRPGRRRPALDELVAAVPGQPRRRVGPGQAAPSVGAQGPDDRRNRQAPGLPGRGRLPGRGGLPSGGGRAWPRCRVRGGHRRAPGAPPPGVGGAGPSSGFTMAPAGPRADRHDRSGPRARPGCPHGRPPPGRGPCAARR